MFRKHERTIAWRSGLLALLVHVVLAGAMLFSFNWKAAHVVVSVSDVELWSELPNNTNPMPVPVPKVVPNPEPEPEVVEEPQPEPETEPEIKPELEEPKVDIELENKKKAEEAKKKKLEDARKKKELAKKEALKKKKLAEKKRKEKLRKIQAAAFDDEVDDENDKRLKDLQQQVGQGDVRKPSGASKGEVNKYVAKIQAKIKGNLIKSLCADGNPRLIFNIKLLPTGEFANNPVLKKSSGNVACDDAVERAIIASEPLPLPKDPDALVAFRDLNLNFKPNE